MEASATSCGVNILLNLKNIPQLSWASHMTLAVGGNVKHKLVCV